MSQSYMKERPVFPLLLSMGLPMALSMLVNSLYNIIDSLFVAKIGENAMTALSLVYPIQNLITSIGVGFGVGINAQIAINLGKGDQESADRSATLGLAFSILHGVLLQGLVFLLTPAFLDLFHPESATRVLALQYTGIAFLFTAVQVVQIAVEKIFQSLGRMKVSMIAMMAGFFTNILLDPIMIFGLGPIPAMGIEGAAWATGFGQGVTLLVYILFYLLTPMAVRFDFRTMQASPKQLLPLYSVGIPATLNMALPSLLISVLNMLLSVYSPVYVLVLGIYYKLQSFLYLPAGGIIQGMRPLIGYNYGAGEHGRVKELYRDVLFLSLGIMLVGTLLCQLYPATLLGLFTEEAETIRVGSTALRIISLGFLVSAISVTACGALEGLGKGMPSLWISLMRYTIVIIPAAALLGHFLGANGVWLAFPVTEAATGIVSGVLYRRETEMKTETDRIDMAAVQPAADPL